MEKVKETLNINLYVVNMNEQQQIYKFLYGIHKSRGVITDSFHASIFSIIFNKPFIAFVNQIGDDGRFNFISFSWILIKVDKYLKQLKIFLSLIIEFIILMKQQKYLYWKHL